MGALLLVGLAARFGRVFLSGIDLDVSRVAFRGSELPNV